MKNKDLEILFKKWELLWNHLKLQHEAYERRRNIVWLIQAALFGAWYKLFFGCHKTFALGVSIFGFIFSFFWFFMCKRERESIFLTDELLRDSEYQINILDKSIDFKPFIMRKNVFGPKGYRENVWKNKYDNLWNLGNKFFNFLNDSMDRLISNKQLKSVKFLLDFLTPLLFILAWLIILLIVIITLISIVIYNH